MPRIRIAISYGISVFNFLSNLHDVLNNDCTNIHSNQQYRGSLFFTPSPAFIVCRFFDDVPSDWYEGHTSQKVIPHCSFDFYFSNN